MIVGDFFPYKYSPSAERYPVEEEGDDEAEEARCEHDGDCSFGGCPHCLSRFRMPARIECAAIYDWRLGDAFCGCVERRCRWFTQRHRKITLEIGDFVLQVSGKRLTHTTTVNEAARLLHQELRYLLNPCYVQLTTQLPARHHFVVTVNDYGVMDARVSGGARSVRKCVQSAFASVNMYPRSISEDFSDDQKIRLSGVVKLQMAWAP